MCFHHLFLDSILFLKTFKDNETEMKISSQKHATMNCYDQRGKFELSDTWILPFTLSL